MSVFENYKLKMSGKGIGLLEFYFWLICPIIAVLNVITIVRMFTGSIVFSTGDFICSLIAAFFAILVIATAVFLEKITFWLCLALPIFAIARNIFGTFMTVISAIELSKTMPFTQALLQAGIAIDFVFDFIVIAFYGIFLFYIIDHRNVFGYDKN